MNLGDFKRKQKKCYDFFCHIVKEKKVQHAYLIETGTDDNALEIAKIVSKMFLCNDFFSDNHFDSCNICNLIENNNYPCLKIISSEGKMIKKDQIISLINDYNKASYFNSKQIYIIENASKLNDYSANTILKFLEEPSENVIALLLTENVNNVLPTIVSRCQIFSLINNTIISDMFSKDVVEELLLYLNNNSSKKLSYNEHPIIYNYDKEKLVKLLLFIYQDALNYLLHSNIEFLIDFKNEIIDIFSNYQINNIINKIQFLQKLTNKVLLNLNNDLFFDQLFIGLFGGKNYD